MITLQGNDEDGDDLTYIVLSEQAGDAPVLIRVQERAGHGLGKPSAILIGEAADIWAFLCEALRG